MTYYIAGVLNM